MVPSPSRGPLVAGTSASLVVHLLRPQVTVVWHLGHRVGNYRGVLERGSVPPHHPVREGGERDGARAVLELAQHSLPGEHPIREEWMRALEPVRSAASTRGSSSGAEHIERSA